MTTVDDISSFSTHKAILYPLRLLCIYFQEQFFSEINYLYQKMFVRFFVSVLFRLYTDFYRDSF